MDGIIFDVDGTLWDSTEVVAEAWNQAISENSDERVFVSAARLKELFGKPMDEIARELFPELSKEERQRLSDECYRYENRLLAIKPGTLYPKVLETVRQLFLKYPLFIVSNCQSGYIEVCIETTGLAPYIRDFICYGDTGCSKGENIRRLMKNNGLTQVIYVGDTKGDAKACREAGVPMIYAAYGFGEDVEADDKIEAFSELPELLLSMEALEIKRKGK